jgi:hypothetical protein
MVCQRCPYRSKFKTASVEPALAFGAQVYSQTPVVLGVLRPHVRMHRQADEACPRAAHKTGAYRNLRFFTLAALVPSAGTLRTLKNLIGLVSGVGTRIPLGNGRNVPPWLRRNSAYEVKMSTDSAAPENGSLLVFSLPGETISN